MLATSSVTAGWNFWFSVALHVLVVWSDCWSGPELQHSGNLPTPTLREREREVGWGYPNIYNPLSVVFGVWWSLSLTKLRPGWSRVAVECCEISCPCVQVYRGWNNMHLYSSTTVPSIVCATHLDNYTLWCRVSPPTLLRQLFTCTSKKFLCMLFSASHILHCNQCIVSNA
jgi:hypothetical protein